MRLFIITLLNVAFFNAYTCDCGGNSLGLDANMLTSTNGNAIGLSIGAEHYKFYTEGDVKNNWLVSWNLTGSYKPHSKVQLSFFMPIMMQTNSLDQHTMWGTGDFVTLMSYTALDKISVERNIKHRITLSGGIDLPTGVKNNYTDRNAIIPFSNKSVDFPLGTSYVMNVKHYIMAAFFLAKLNTTNKDHYKYGSTIETVWQNSLKIDIKAVQLFPSVGLKYYWQHKDISHNFVRNFSGGYVFSEIMGLQVNIIKHKLAINMEIPFSRHLNSVETKTGNNYNIQYIYQF